MQRVAGVPVNKQVPNPVRERAASVGSEPAADIPIVDKAPLETVPTVAEEAVPAVETVGKTGWTTPLYTNTSPTNLSVRSASPPVVLVLFTDGVRFSQVMKQALSRMAQARQQMTQMNFQGAITRLDFSLRKLADVLPSLLSTASAQPSPASVLALLTAQAMQVWRVDLWEFG